LEAATGGASLTVDEDRSAEITVADRNYFSSFLAFEKR